MFQPRKLAAILTGALCALVFGLWLVASNGLPGSSQAFGATSNTTNPTKGYLSARKLSQRRLSDSPVGFNLTNTATPAIQTGSATTWTFSNQSLGATDPSRYILVTAAVHKVGGTPSLSSVSVAGNSKNTPEVTVNGTGGNASQCSVWSVAVTSNVTTGDVVITAAANLDEAHVNVFRMVGAASGTATATATDNSGALSQSLTIPSNGGAVGVGAEMNGGSGTFTWSGLTKVGSDTVFSGTGTITHAAGMLSDSSATSGTIGLTYTGSLANHCMGLAAFGP